MDDIATIFTQLKSDAHNKHFTMYDYPYLNPINIRTMSTAGVIQKIKCNRTWKKEPTLWAIVPGKDMSGYTPYRKRPAEYRLALYKCQAVNCSEIQEIYVGKRPASICGVAKRSVSEISLCPKRLI